MSSFISSPAPAASEPDASLSFWPFWPDIDVNHFRDAMRIGGTLIPDARVADAIMRAAIGVGDDLAEWRTAREVEGYKSLEAVPSPLVGEETRLVLLWRLAVYGYATADLRESHGDITATGQGQSRAEDLDMSAEDHRRNAIHAIRAILGKGRTTVELI